MTEQIRDSRDSIVRAIVHLNFNEPEQALEVLLQALTEINFKENSHGDRTEYAA